MHKHTLHSAHIHILTQPHTPKHTHIHVYKHMHAHKQTSTLAKTDCEIYGAHYNKVQTIYETTTLFLILLSPSNVEFIFDFIMSCNITLSYTYFGAYCVVCNMYIVYCLLYSLWCIMYGV